MTEPLDKRRIAVPISPFTTPWHETGDLPEQAERMTRIPGTPASALAGDATRLAHRDVCVHIDSFGV